MSRDKWEPMESAPDEHYVWLLYDFPKHGPTPVLGIRRNDPMLINGGRSWFAPETIMWNGRTMQGTWVEAWVKGWKRFCDFTTDYSEARGHIDWVAQARAATAKTGAVHESAVPERDAP